MFLHYLSEQQQAALLHYCYEMMRADSVVEASETERLNALRSQAHAGVKARDVPIAELGALFEDRLSRIALLLELVGMGYVDEEFILSESRLITDIAKTLHIGEDDVANVMSWVKRQMLLVEEAHELMRG